MSAFNSIDSEKYNSEVYAKWGTTDAYKEYKQKAKDYSKQKEKELCDETDRIMAEFSLCLKNEKAPESEEAQRLVKKLQDFISENYYTCTNEILSCLGIMYTADERFLNNIDKHVEGTAAFINQAIGIYCRK